MDELVFYRRHSALTDPGRHRQLVAGVPGDLRAMCELIQGAVCHRDETSWRFGFALPEQRRAEADTRFAAAILDHLGDFRPRPPDQRFAGTCRDFSVLACSMLREAGVPARMRAGFAGYFQPGFFGDHWVVEFWDGTGAWRLLDAQVAGDHGDYGVDIDPLNVPRDAFLVGGQAWQDCRTGRRNPDDFGVVRGEIAGMWEIQGNVIRDLASLNRLEMLPWDNWGLITKHYEQLNAEEVGVLDRAAAISAAGGPVEDAIEFYWSDERLQVPASAAAAAARPVRTAPSM
jgi:transglutaminase superfamily protein